MPPQPPPPYQQPLLPPTPHKPRNRVGLVLAFVLAGVILIGGSIAGFRAFGSVTDSIVKDGTPTLPTIIPPTEFDVTGTVEVDAADYLYDSSEGDLCWTDGGYTDIEDGAQIEVQNGEGDTLALGTLGTGVMNSTGDCEFPFTISDIPEGESIYSFRAGNSVRGGMKYTRDQLKEMGEVLALGFS
jgi:hypothetical protein